MSPKTAKLSDKCRVCKADFHVKYGIIPKRTREYREARDKKFVQAI